MKKLLVVAVLALAACGRTLEEEGPPLASQEEALTSCNRLSDPECVGLASGSVCDTTGRCRPDPDVHGACDCVIATPPPPPIGCSCNGIPLNQSCGFGRTCKPVLSGQIFYCACQ